MSAQIFLLYAKLEEEHGLPQRDGHLSARRRGRRAREEGRGVQRLHCQGRRVLRRHEDAGHLRARDQRTAHSPRAEHVRALRQPRAQLGELGRARAIYMHGSQQVDPAAENSSFWQVWHDFEVSHGNEDTFREMLRISARAQHTSAAVVHAAGRQAQARRRGLPPSGMAALDAAQQQQQQGEEEGGPFQRARAQAGGGSSGARLQRGEQLRGRAAGCFKMGQLGPATIAMGRAEEAARAAAAARRPRRRRSTLTTRRKTPRRADAGARSGLRRGHGRGRRRRGAARLSASAAQKAEDAVVQLDLERVYTYHLPSRDAPFAVLRLSFLR